MAKSERVPKAAPKRPATSVMVSSLSKTQRKSLYAPPPILEPHNRCGTFYHIKSNELDDLCVTFSKLHL